MQKHLYLILLLTGPFWVISQSVEVQGTLKVSDMDNFDTEDHLVVKRPDGTLATRMVASLPPPPDTTRSLQSDLLLTSALCNCPSLPPAMIQSLLDNGYSIQDLVDFKISAQDLLAAGLSTQELLAAGLTVQELLDAGKKPLDLYNEFVPEDSLYGRFYAGGLIFYLDTLELIPAFEGLVASPMNQSDGTIWGCSETDITGADDTIIGSGSQNTADIDLECTTPDIAADLCINLTLNGFSDWFLPSLDELNEMYNNIGPGAPAPNTDIGDFEQLIYWSSSEVDSAIAMRVFFADGIQLPGGKGNNTVNVRAIRAF